MWSVPPAEPPPQATEPVSALSLAIRSARVFISEAAGTTTTSYSPVRRAIGVTWSRVAGDLLVRMAPIMTRPLTMSTLPLPFSLSTSCARPTVPPAPATFSTVTDFAWPPALITSSSARAVWSQPPPGFAGAMIRRSSSASAGVVKCEPAMTSEVASRAASFRPDRRFMMSSLERKACDATGASGSKPIALPRPGREAMNVRLSSHPEFRNLYAEGQWVFLGRLEKPGCVFDDGFWKHAQFVFRER